MKIYFFQFINKPNKYNETFRQTFKSLISCCLHADTVVDDSIGSDNNQGKCVR